MATLKDIKDNKAPTASDLEAIYGADAAPLRRLLAATGQSDVDLFHDAFDTQATGGSDSGQGGTISPQMQALIDKGYMTHVEDSGGGEGGGGSTGHWQVNWDKVPGGDPAMGQMSAYSPSMHDVLFNPDLVKQDPNLGWITPTANVDLHHSKWEELGYQAGPAIAMAIMTMGAGLPAMMTSAPRALQAASDHDYWGAATAALPVAGEVAGIDPSTVSNVGRAVNVGRSLAGGDYVGAGLGVAGAGAGAAGIPQWVTNLGAAFTRQWIQSQQSHGGKG
jgi:hypothetical protein